MTAFDKGYAKLAKAVRAVDSSLAAGVTSARASGVIRDPYGLMTKAVFENAFVAKWNDVKDHPLIDGFSVGFFWSHIETGTATYDWSDVDVAIEAISAEGKFVELKIAGGCRTPAHVYTDNPTLDSFSLTTSTGTYTCPYFWTSTYKTIWNAFVDKIAERYADDVRVSQVVCAGPNTDEAEFFVSNTAEDEITQLETEGWTTTLHVTSWEEAIDKFVASFPAQKIVWRGAPIDGVTTHTFAVMDHIKDNHPGRCVVTAGSIADNGTIDNAGSLFHQFWAKMGAYKEWMIPHYQIGEAIMSDGPQWSVADNLADLDAYGSVLDAVDTDPSNALAVTGEYYQGGSFFGFEGRYTNTDVDHSDILRPFRVSIMRKAA